MKKDTQDSIKEEITTLRDDNKNLFVVMMATLTGSFTVLYKLLDHLDNFDLNATIKLLIAVCGVLLSFVLLKVISIRKQQIDELIEKLKGLE